MTLADVIARRPTLVIDEAAGAWLLTTETRAAIPRHTLLVLVADELRALGARVQDIRRAGWVRALRIVEAP